MSLGLRSWIPSVLGSEVEAAVESLNGKNDDGEHEGRSYLTRLPDGLTIHLTHRRHCQITNVSNLVLYDSAG
jgi:hypothetical protein